MDAWKETEEKAEACPGTSQQCPRLPCGQKCRYVFEGIDNLGRITGYHLTPKKSYKDKISFAFSENGENCNVRNLLDGASLSQTNGFTESTSTNICTQYDQI